MAKVVGFCYAAILKNTRDYLNFSWLCSALGFVTLVYEVLNLPRGCMKLSGNTMSNCIGISLAGCLALLVAKFLGLIGLDSTYLASFIGIFIGTITHYLFFRSVKNLKKTELEQQKAMKDLLSVGESYKVVLMGEPARSPGGKGESGDLPLDLEQTKNSTTLSAVELEGFVILDEVHRSDGDELFIRQKISFQNEADEKKIKQLWVYIY